jgi:hypothetical protein
MLQIGAGTIQSFDDNTREAQVCGTLYDGIKRSELASYPWSFATDNLECNQLLTAPLNPIWQYAYQLPSDFVRLRNFYDTSGYVCDYYVNGDEVWAGVTQLFCEYTQYQSESNLPDYFIDLLVARIAWESARAVIGIQSDVETARQEYLNKRAEARNTDANANQPEQLVSPFNSSIVRARQGYSDTWF